MLIEYLYANVPTVIVFLALIVVGFGLLALLAERFCGFCAGVVPPWLFSANSMVVALYLVMLFSNLRMLGGTYGVDNKDFAELIPTYMTPSPVTFSYAWRVIYAGLTVVVVLQLNPPPTSSFFAQKCAFTDLDVRTRLGIAFSANACWLPLFTNPSFSALFTAQIAVTVYVLALLSLYNDLNVHRAKGLWEHAIAMPVSLAAGWGLVAFLLGLTACLRMCGFQEYGVGGAVWYTLALCSLVAANGFLQGVRGDVGFAAITAWALAGVADAQSALPEPARSGVLAHVVGLLAAAVGAAALIGAVRLCRKPKEAALLDRGSLEMRA